MVFVVAAAVAVDRLDSHVDGRLVERFPNPKLVIDVPECLVGSADRDVSEVLLPLLELDWTDRRLCREMAARAATVGWVKRVRHVRRTSEGVFEVRCVYREPFAMVVKAGEFILVDEEGVRLPGLYRYDPAWILIQGAADPIPEVARRWEGEDLAAGLSLVGLIRDEQFASQITAVLVDNCGGRVDPRRAHFELATDRVDGRIRWGSAPGMELEENTVAQKLAILRDVFRRTGRVDADEVIIDVSVYPDRYIVGG